MRSNAYRFFWAASLLSNSGTWIQQVAEPWVVLALTKSSFWIGADNFAMNAPGWALTLIGGVLADRVSRRQLVYRCQAVQMAAIALLTGTRTRFDITDALRLDAATAVTLLGVVLALSRRRP